MPHILFLTRALDIGGAQRQLVELATGMQAAGWRVTVATFYAGGPLEALLRERSIPLVSLEKRGRWQVLPFLWRLARTIRRVSPDVVYSFLDMPNLLVTALRPLYPRVRIVWGIAASNMDFVDYGWLARVEWRTGIFLSRFADLIISNSEEGRRYHASEGYPPGRMVVIPNGVDLERFRIDAGARERVRAQWGISPHTKLIGLVARVDLVKDHANFLHAASIVARTRPDVHFVCVGPAEGAYYNAMVDLGRTLGLSDRMLWAGERSDVEQVYNALDIAVCSSLTEGLPNVVCEAMASGVPCVVTDVGDSAVVVGSLGWIVPPANSTALADALCRALQALPIDPESLRSHIRTQYSRAALVQRTIEALENLPGQSIAARTRLARPEA